MRSMRRILVAAVGRAIVAPSVGAVQRENGARPSPPREGALLPTPPRQDEPWTPPKSALPESLVEAARVLIEQGLADPRGCAYREVEPASEAEAYRDFHKRPPATHAWVIPFDATGGPRYAVAWNGLVYPVTKLGPAADLEADIRALAKAFDGSGGMTMASAMSHGLYPDPMRQGRASGDLQSARHSDLAPTKAVLLLRLGRIELAELVCKTGPGWQAAVAPGGPIQRPGLYANLAADWERALLDRAASAHSRGDDPLALASLRTLARIRPLIEAMAPIMRPRVPGPRNGPGFEAPDFLVEFPRFLADQERRARESKRTAGLASTFPDRETRIAAPIRSLDQISFSRRPFMVPGRANPAGDAPFQAIIKEGDAAVGALLDGLERDDRLTWTVERDYRHNSRYLHIQGTGTAEVLRLDLRELFALDRPGRYRIEVALDGIRAEERQPARVSADFTLKAAEDAMAP